MEFRIADINDVELLVELRKEQLLDEGSDTSRSIDTALRNFFANALKNGDLVQVLAMENSEVIATGGIGFYQLPPGYENPTGKKAYLSSVYTKPPYRRRGIASKVVDFLMEEGKSRGIIKYWLFASTMGKPVYKKKGFNEADDYMEITLEELD